MGLELPKQITKADHCKHDMRNSKKLDSEAFRSVISCVCWRAVSDTAQAGLKLTLLLNMTFSF